MMHYTIYSFVALEGSVVTHVTPEHINEDLEHARACGQSAAIGVPDRSNDNNVLRPKK